MDTSDSSGLSSPVHNALSVYDFECTTPKAQKSSSEISTPSTAQEPSDLNVSEMQTELTQCYQRIEQQQSEIEFLKSQLNAKKSGGKPKFDRALPVEVRRIYALHKHSYDFTRRFDFIENKVVTQRIYDGIEGLHGRSYTLAEVTMCCKTYFKSLKDDRQREENGIKDKHRKAAARRHRLKSKLKRRKKCLNSVTKPPLSEDQLQKAHDMVFIGDMDYVSSDESEDEADEKNTRLVRRLWFESPEMTEIKRVIDEHYIQVTPKKGLSKMLTLLKNGCSPVSSREVPKKVLNWAVDVFSPSSQNSALDSVDYTEL